MADDDLKNDLLNGAEAIAAFLNQTERRIYHLLETGKLPAFKLGDRKWQARKSSLRRHIEALEAKAGGKRCDGGGSIRSAFSASDAAGNRR